MLPVEPMTSPVLPEVPVTVAPVASPLVAVEVGAEVAAPLLPDCDDPSVEVVELPLVAVAEESVLAVASPE